MPRAAVEQKPVRLVKCLACGKVQEDEGRRNTCIRCGFQPIPSYSYPRTCCFHPGAQAKGL